MNALSQFAKRIEEQLSNANREPHWTAEDAARYMSEVGARREKFEQVAERLIKHFIQPRLELLASRFPNASLAKDQLPGRVVCWFGYCERFPASTKVVFTVEHDVRIERLAVCYEASMVPVFVKLMERDKVTSPLEQIHEDEVAGWVEERLLDFLDCYLRIDRGTDDAEDESVTDPVCGMRIQRTSAVGTETYRGHPYFFCSADCQAKFAREPTAFVQVKTS